jgi:hypothetical protein
MPGDNLDTLYEYCVLFGDKDDDRIKLFLNELYEQSIENRKQRKSDEFSINDIKLTKISMKFENQYFINKVNGADDSVHPEWKCFFNDVQNFINNKNKNNTIVDENLIEQMKTIADTNIKQFIIFIVNKIIDMENKKYKAVNVLDVFINESIKPKFVYDQQINCENHKYFRYEIGKYFLKKYFDEAVTRSASADLGDVFAPSSGSTKTPVYYRNIEGKLCVTRNGKEVEVGRDSEEFKNIFSPENASRKCFTTGYKGTGEGKECKDFIMECLAGTGVEKCASFLESENFWEIAVNEVKEMNPEVAVLLLKKLEFEKVRATVTRQVYGRPNTIHITKMESVEKWVERLAKNNNLDKDSAVAIGKNEKLIGYLKLVVDKINDNLAVLNPDYDDRYGEMRRMTNDDSYLGKSGMQHRPRRLVQYASDTDAQLVRGYFQNSPANLSARNSVRVNLPGVGVYRMIGGAELVDPTDPKQYYIDEEAERKLRFTGDILLSRFNVIKKQLAAHGKSISKEDNDKIIMLIDSLTKNEIILNKFIIYTNAFIKLMLTAGENVGEDVLNFQNLKNLVDTRSSALSKASNKSSALINVLDTLVVAINVPR